MEILTPFCRGKIKVIRVFPSRTNHTPIDEYAFIGDPPMMRPQADEVCVSCVFTWDKIKSERLVDAWRQYYPIVKLGGPAYDDPGGEFIPGLYVRKGITYNMRGCNNQCPWCDAWRREGKARAIPISEGCIEQSNNLLQCNYSHVDTVFDMLSVQRSVVLAGIEASRVTEKWANRIRSLNLRQIFVAADTPSAIKAVRKAVIILQVPRNKVRCYVLLKFNPNETISDATMRMIDIWDAGAIPFAQLYQPATGYIEYSKEWKDFARKWSRPAIITTIMGEK